MAWVLLIVKLLVGPGFLGKQVLGDDAPLAAEGVAPAVPAPGCIGRTIVDLDCFRMVMGHSGALLVGYPFALGHRHAFAVQLAYVSPSPAVSEVARNEHIAERQH